MTTTIRKPARKNAAPTRKKATLRPTANKARSSKGRKSKSKSVSAKKDTDCTLNRQTASLASPNVPKVKPGTKTHILLTLLARAKGATAEELMTAVGWQKPGARAGIISTNPDVADRSAHSASTFYKGDIKQKSVHGFLAGTVKKKLGLTLSSEKHDDGPRRYRIVKNGE